MGFGSQPICGGLIGSFKYHQYIGSQCKSACIVVTDAHCNVDIRRCQIELVHLKNVLHSAAKAGCVTGSKELFGIRSCGFGAA